MMVSCQISDVAEIGAATCETSWPVVVPCLGGSCGSVISRAGADAGLLWQPSTEVTDLVFQVLFR